MASRRALGPDAPHPRRLAAQSHVGSCLPTAGRTVRPSSTRRPLEHRALSPTDSYEPPPDGTRPRPDHPSSRVGRPRSTDRAQIAHEALSLFVRQGFEATTVDEIAAAVGITRRTLFRYYPSKNDVVWGEFDAELDALRVALRAMPADLPVIEVVRHGVLAFNDWGGEGLDELRQRMRLITTVPALQAHATLRYADWSNVVAEFVAERTEDHREGLVPQAVAAAALGAAMTAYRRWVAHGGDLLALIDAALALVVSGFSEDAIASAARTTPT